MSSIDKLVMIIVLVISSICVSTAFLIAKIDEKDKNRK